MMRIRTAVTLIGKIVNCTRDFAVNLLQLRSGLRTEAGP
jgi:hypothetical protein